MSEQDPNLLVGIRPRTPEQDMRDAQDKALHEAFRNHIGGKQGVAAGPGLSQGLLDASRPGEDEKLAAYRNEVFAKEQARQLAIRRLEQQNALNSAVNHVDATTLANAMAGLSQEVEAMARHVGRLDELARSLLDNKAPFTDDDVAAIKAHVRHPGALEAAKLRETVRCLRIAADNGNWTTVSSILGGLDAEG